MTAFIRALDRALTVREIVAASGGAAHIVGEPERRVEGLGALQPGYPHTLTFCDAGSTQDRAAKSQASVILVSEPWQPAADQTRIVVDDPRAAFIHLVEHLLPGSGRPREPATGVHPSARIHADAEISPAAAIGANVAIGAGTRVGANAVIYDNCTIGANCCIGPGAVVGWVGLAYHQGKSGRREFSRTWAACASAIGWTWAPTVASAAACCRTP